MSFQPVIPIGGYAGWKLLARTQERQQAAFNESTQIVREVDQFREKIATLKSSDDLVNDRTLLKVALGAFGLEGDIDNKAYIKKVLDDGVFNPDALANRLSDKRYKAFSEAFGFGDFGTSKIKISTFPDEIIEAYKTLQFETAVGEQNADMRMAMGFERELDRVLSANSSENGRWFAIMGSPPLRTVFETALGLPSSLGAIDLDLQLKAFKEKADSVFKTTDVSVFKDADRREELTRSFLVRSEILNGTQANYSASSAALSLLQSMPSLF